MSAAPDWAKLIADAPPAPVLLGTALSTFQSNTAPALVRCHGDERFVVNGMRTAAVGRVLFVEQVVGRLGAAMGAPVPEMALVDVRSAHAAGHAAPLCPLGIGSGSREIPHARFAYASDFGGWAAPRMAPALVLFEWFGGRPNQLLVGVSGAYPCDFGGVLPGGEQWRSEQFEQWRAPDLRAAANFADLGPALRALAAVTVGAIAAAVAAPPSWGVPGSDRVALAFYLAARRDILADLDTLLIQLWLSVSGGRRHVARLRLMKWDQPQATEASDLYQLPVLHARHIAVPRSEVQRE